MRTALKSAAKLPRTIADYGPDDLETMRQAFLCACLDNPTLSETEIQRYDLADAMVSVYRKHFTQQGLIAAALRKMRVK
jgi:hypothetical protein